MIDDVFEKEVEDERWREVTQMGLSGLYALACRDSTSCNLQTWPSLREDYSGPKEQRTCTLHLLVLNIRYGR